MELYLSIGVSTHRVAGYVDGAHNQSDGKYHFSADTNAVAIHGSRGPQVHVVRETTETIFAVLYALARIGLLVEAAYLLRDMSDAALHVVDWMYFLPHI